ncbi:alpha-soluble NSF attachment protein 2-like [Selaginella moellendorffii]|uniref:alpha-soluble NSF attachment protein 2-like n=1 Tax=Selaginella moellendorffii TaxID=88036 RepID=UPI000D1CB5E1|nr:alpha-soluble NSF attachment protein 2-like [Selaginella moellendorffii]|eukprot:XP_024544284.1 alpha-soluble NSF attachment protein 2-like [Selaginella moellendorffii]
MAFLWSNPVKKLEEEKRWSEAAEIHMKQGIDSQSKTNISESAISYTKAAECFRRDGSTDKAVAAWHLAKVAWKKLGPSCHLLAAICSKNIGELESNERALEAFKEASVLFGNTNLKESLRCQIRAANLAVVIAKFGEATQMFEAIARSTPTPSKVNVRSSLFKAAVCRVLDARYGDLDRVVKHEYEKLDPGFGSSAEFRIVQGLYLSIDMEDEHGFCDSVDACAKMFGAKETLVKELLYKCYTELAAF